VRKAVVDIGSNSVLLLVGARRSDGGVDIELDRATITRLSQGAATTGSLAPAAVQRTLACLRDYAAVAHAQKVPLTAVATEGLRMVSNADAFLGPAAAILGGPPRVLAGEQEARLSYLSVALEERRTEEDTPLRVLDIGGGSTELVVGRGRAVEQAMSHPIGSVRLTEIHVHHDPPTRAELLALEGAVSAAFAGQPLDPFPELHGVAGTVTTAAALHLGLSAYDRERVDGVRMRRTEVGALRADLAAQTTADRARIPCIDAGRADVIVAGLTILLGALEHCGAETLVVRDRGLRYALL
jgi:exopolyphosphatase/guanosine-5'-triphosphate,3'-diphosphate pyrophosphatase